MAPRRSSPPTSLARASAAILLATVTAAAAAPAAATAPSFVVVLLDDLDELLNGTAAMPNVAALLRAQGTSLRGFVDVPICCPSRTSTLSGRYSHNLNNTALGWCGDFEAQHENRTWVQRLRAAGYATGLFGKYYNAYASFCEANVKVPSDWTRFFTMCDDNNFFGNAFNDQGAMLHVGKNVYMTDVIANKSLEWLATAAADPAPFFAYVAPHAPHVPATPAHKYENAPLPQNATRAPRTPSWDAAAPQHHWVVAEKAPLTPALIDFSDELWARRLRATMSVDDLVGDLLALLQAAGRIENTYIFFTSDHGYNLGQFRLPSGKFHAFEQDIRVPFIVRGPGVARGAVRENVMVNNVDLAATVLELSGVAAADYVHDGRSFATQLTAAPPAWPRDRLLFEYWGMGYTMRGPCHNGTSPCPGGAEALEDAPSNTWSGLRIVNATHNIKYAEFRPAVASPIEPASTNFTLAFDLNADPWELVNAAAPGGSMSPATLAQLSAELWAVATCAGTQCP